MPAPLLSSLAKRAGVSLKRAERYWNEAKKQADAQQPTDRWSYVVGIVKRRLGLENIDLAMTGWPVNLIVETGKNEKIVPSGYFIRLEDKTQEERTFVAKSLQEAGASVFVHLPGMEVLSFQFEEKNKPVLIKKLKESGIKICREHQVCDPHLVSIFLADMYRSETTGKETGLVKEGKLKENILDEMLLLEGVTNWDEWLRTLFPHVDIQLVRFIADQGAKK